MSNFFEKIHGIVKGRGKEENKMDYFAKKIEEIPFDRKRKWSNTNKEEFAILLSAPSCLIYGWNLDYMKIDSVAKEEIHEKLKGFNIHNQDDVYGYYEEWFNGEVGDGTVGEDYDQFKSFWDGEPSLDLKELSSNGQEAFLSCKKFAENFKDIVGVGGFAAWDYAEIIPIIRMGYTMEWLSYEEASKLLCEVADEAYEEFDSWKEFAISFICGGAYWEYKRDGFDNWKFNEKRGYEFFDTLYEVVWNLFTDSECGYWNEPVCVMSKEYSQVTKEIIDKINCPHQVFTENNTISEVNSAYKKSLAQVKEKGFIPVLVPSDDTLAEWLEDLEDDSYSKEDIITQKRRDAEQILQERFKEYTDYIDEEENLTMNDFLGEKKDGEVIGELSAFEDYGEDRIQETILFEIPVKNPWEVIAWLPMGGWNECPEASEMMEICRYWYEQYGAIPAVISNDTLEFVVEKAVEDEEQAWQLAKEHYAFCPDRVDQGTRSGTIGEVADCLSKSKVWFFWWD